MKLMQWRENNDQLSLYLTVDGSNWYHYTNPLFSAYCKPDTILEGIQTSKGYRTAQSCLKLGFKYLDKEGNLID